MKIIKIIFLLLIFKLSAISQTSSEYLMLHEINILRSNPIKYVDNIISFKNKKIDKFNAKYNLNLSGFNITKDTRNKALDSLELYYWVKSCDETIDFLKNSLPIDTLIFDKKIYNLLKNYDYSSNICNNFVTHTKITVMAEIEAENFICDERDVKNTIVELLIDKDIVGKGHRLNLMNGKFKYVGIYENKFGPITFIQHFIK